MVRITALRRERFKCPQTALPITTEVLFPEPSTLPPWVTSPAALKAWYNNANKLRDANTVNLWRNAATQGDNFTLEDMAFLRKMNRPFEEFTECKITVDNSSYQYRITMDLKLSFPHADALAKVESIDHITFRHNDQALTCLGQRPVWSSSARFELRDRGPVLAPFLCLSQEDVRPYTIVMHGASAMWSAVRAFVRARAIALYWQETTQRRLCAPGGVGRMLDRLAYEQWNFTKELWA